MNTLSWPVAGLLALLILGLFLWVVRQIRRAVSHWYDSAARRALHRFRIRVERFKLTRRAEVEQLLEHDPVVEEAITTHAAEQGQSIVDTRREVEAYIKEIVPFFNVLSYYRLGYSVSRYFLGLLYRVVVVDRDEQAPRRIPKGDVVVYLMNHRSNADYVVVAFILAGTVSISYAVGEWARTWPLEYIFKSFGSYFIRRRYRVPLYHAVLERYVQLITRHGVTQGIFPEGGLTRDGALRPPKLGLLDYLVRTLQEPEFEKDIWLVPVGVNYDRVLEDRTLIRERMVKVRRSGRIRQFAAVLHYMTFNFVRLVTGRFQRYGQVAVAFGAPLSVRTWLAEHQPNALTLPKHERLPVLQGLALDALDRIGQVVPVTPVPLAASALLSFGTSAIDEGRLLDRLDELRDALVARGAVLSEPSRSTPDWWDDAWRMLRMRRLVVHEGSTYVILPRQRPLLEYYANSIRHLIPHEHRAPMTPAAEDDPTLPRLARREEMTVESGEYSIRDAPDISGRPRPDAPADS